MRLVAGRRFTGLLLGLVLAVGAAGGAAGAGPRTARPVEPALDVLTADGNAIPLEDEGAPPAQVVQTRGAPAYPEPVELSQPDGTTFTARQWGDGAFGGHELLDGHTIEQREDGTWVFVEGVDASGEVVVGDTPAHVDPPSGVAPGVRGEDPGPLPSPSARGPSGAPHVPHTGTAPTLVILARFADQTSATTASSWAGAFFGGSDSVRDYYLDASYGDLTIAPAAEAHGTTNDGVVGWVTLARNHPNTGSINSTTDYQNVNGTVRDAVLAANPYVNFATFDTDGDGLVEPRELHVVVITAGFEASYSSACGKTVWGHQWALHYATPPSVDGKTVAAPGGGSYTMFGERHCSGGSDDHRATIGIMVHEIGHDLGWPDLYDVTGATEGGVGTWSVMASGSWGSTSGEHPGATPSLPDAFSRSYQGWVVPSQVTGTDQARTVPSASTSDVVYRVLSNPGGVDWAFQSSGNQTGTGEYFLIENRTQTNWDASLPGCGILIWHIDETRSAAQPNATASRRLVQLEQADGLGHVDGSLNRGDAGDPYPGSSNRTLFAAGTNPSSRLYSGADSGVSVQVPSGGCTASKAIAISTTGGSTPTPPPNDSFSNPVTLTGTSGTRTGTTVAATKQAGEPAHAGAPGGASIWYRWTVPTTGRAQVNLAGSGFDTLLGLYVGGSVGALVPVAANDDAGGGLQSRVTDLPVVAGTVLHVAVDGWAGATGSVALAYSLTATPGPAPLGSWSAFVDRQFRDLIGRAPTASERSTWVTRLSATAGDRGELIAFLRTSSRHTNIVDPVVRLYRAYFLRHADAAGLDYWIDQRLRGRSIQSVSQAFAVSPEFRERYGTLTNRQFVERIYLNILGRPGEQAGITYWTAELNAGRRNRGQVMVGFSESPEYRASSRVEVDLAVVTLMVLGRRPLPHELPMWRYERTQGRFSNARLGLWALAHASY